FLLVFHSFAFCFCHGISHWLALVSRFYLHPAARDARQAPFPTQVRSPRAPSFHLGRANCRQDWLRLPAASTRFLLPSPAPPPERGTHHPSDSGKSARLRLRQRLCHREELRVEPVLNGPQSTTTQTLPP